MPGAGVQIVRDRVGGSVVSGAADGERLVLIVQLVSVGVLRGVGALLLSRAGGLGCARTARQRRPQRALRAEGALEPVGKVLTKVRAERRLYGSACYARDLPGHFDQPLWLPVDGAGGLEMSLSDPCLIRSRGPSGEPVVRLGVPLLDDYLEFLAGRCRPNTVLAVAYDLRVFFAVVGKPPAEVVPADVLAFVTAQRTGRGQRRVGCSRSTTASGGVGAGRCGGGCRACRGCSPSCRPAAT